MWMSMLPPDEPVSETERLLLWAVEVGARGRNEVLLRASLSHREGVPLLAGLAERRLLREFGRLEAPSYELTEAGRAALGRAR